MDVSNDTKTPSDTRVTSGGSGMGGNSPIGEWQTLQPGQKLRLDLKGAGPWKVEFRVMKGGRRRIVSEVAQTPHDVVELIEAGDDVDVRITRPRASASQ